MTLLCLLGFSSCNCGEDANPGVHIDAAVDQDPDAGTPDHTPDASTALPDGGADLDADAGVALATCESSAQGTLLSLPVASAATSDYTLTSAGSRFHLALRQDHPCSALHATSLSSRGALSTLSSIAGESGCTAYRHVALSPTVSAPTLLAFVDNSLGSAELFTIELDAKMSASTAPRRVTENAAFESSIALTQLDAGPLLAYVSEQDGSAGITTQLLNGDATAHTAVARSAGHSPAGLCLSPMGSSGSAALGWVSAAGSDASSTGVFLKALDADGAASGTAIRLSALAGPEATLDLAQQTRGGDVEQGGAAIYSVAVGTQGQELRFQRLSSAGSPRGDERKLLGTPLRGRDASITALGDGYAVAYRALPDGALITTPQIRLMFLTADGDVAQDRYGRPISYRIADATELQSRLTLRASLDGQLLVAFIDTAPQGGYTLKLQPLRLDCAL